MWTLQLDMLQTQTNGQPGKMNDLAYFCREPKNVLPAENNNNR